MKANYLKITTAFAAVALTVTACKTNVSSFNEEGHGLDISSMDIEVNPKDDFYNYVNGTWMRENEIPDDETRWGGFNILRKETAKNVLDILKNAQKSGKYGADTDQGKAVLVFESKLDKDARNKEGIAPIFPILEKIEAMETIADFQKLMSEEVVEASQPFVGLRVFSDPRNSAMNIAYLSPGRLGLPDRDFYINEDEESVKIREQYVAHITRMLQFLGDTKEEAQKQAETILAFETELAVPRFDKVQSRDFRNFNNPYSVDDLQALVPQIDWATSFKAMGVEETIDTLMVMQPKYMEQMEKMFQNPDIDTWKTVMRWTTFNGATGVLTTEIEEANWEFYDKTLNGAQMMKPAEERALETVNYTVGEALGQLYVEEMFPPEAKEKAEEMIENVIIAFEERIKALDWMGEETKAKAIEKLEKFTVKIGYPDQWKDYSTMEVKEGNSYYQNMLAVRQWNWNRNVEKVNQPVDRTEWGMTPQTVNAYFSPMNNEIVFPAAILQPPFYDYKADEAVNYGGMGAVIGHEISHAFDDSGSRFDADGNLVDWWTKEDLENFTERADALATQYSEVEVLDGVFINGKFTLGENIGDLGGLLGAYDGLQRYFEKHGRPDNIDGFTPEQRFFMSWATIWRTKIREEALRNQVKTDPHSPGEVRATQPLLNIDAFYEAFDVKEGDKMYIAPEDRVRIW